MITFEQFANKFYAKVPHVVLDFSIILFFYSFEYKWFLFIYLFLILFIYFFICDKFMVSVLSRQKS